MEIRPFGVTKYKVEHRTLQLVGQHKEHGWEQDETMISKSQPKRRFYRCPCGWFGWVDQFER